MNYKRNAKQIVIPEESMRAAIRSFNGRIRLAYRHSSDALNLMNMISFCLDDVRRSALDCDPEDTLRLSKDLTALCALLTEVIESGMQKEAE